MYDYYDDDSRSRELRRSSSAGSRGRTSGRSTRDTRTRSSRSTRSSGRGSSRRSSLNGRPRNNAVTVKPLGVAILVVLSVLLAVVLTRCTMTPKIKAAQKAEREAKNEVVELKNQVASLENSLAQAQAELKNQGVESPWTKSGKFTTGDDTLDKEVKTFCDKNSGTGLAQADAALEVYKAVAWADYVERDNAQDPKGKDWRIVYAKQYYENDCSGNCYEFAAFLAYCLQYMGYEDAVSQVVIVELQSGGWGDHGLVFLTDTNGRACLCDTSLGTDGWLLDADAYNVEIQDVENA